MKKASLLREFALVLGLLVCLPGMATAVEVSGLFEAAVPVANQGAGERARATAEGFRQVLVKASGQRSVLANPAVQQELGKAESLLGSYRYETARNESAAAGQAAGAGDSAQGSSRIRLKFDSSSVLGVLNRGGAPVWSASRPQIFLWVMREGVAPQLFALGTQQADVLLDMAAQRGLPVAVPAPGDMAAVAQAGGAPAPVIEMAARMGAKVVLAASVSATPGKIRATGVLRVEGGEQRIDAGGADETDALRELVAQAADMLGARYGVVARQDQITTVSLRIDGIRSLADWAALERWLASQPLVKDAVVSRVDATGTDFTLVLAGDLERLLQAMRAEGRFAGIGQPVPEGSVTRIVATLVAPVGQ